MFDNVDTGEWTGAVKSEKEGTEENLVRQYCHRYGGVIFTEVPLLKEEWGRKARRIDAIRFLRHKEQRRIVTHPGSKKEKKSEFEEHLEGAARKREKVWVVEAKKTLNRSVIGQVIIAKYLLMKAKKRVTPKMVIICGKNLKQFDEICEKLQIQVWTPKKAKLKQ